MCYNWIFSICAMVYYVTRQICFKVKSIFKKSSGLREERYVHENKQGKELFSFNGWAFGFQDVLS